MIPYWSHELHGPAADGPPVQEPQPAAEGVEVGRGEVLLHRHAQDAAGRRGGPRGSPPTPASHEVAGPGGQRRVPAPRSVPWPTGSTPHMTSPMVAWPFPSTPATPTISPASHLDDRPSSSMRPSAARADTFDRRSVDLAGPGRPAARSPPAAATRRGATPAAAGGLVLVQQARRRPSPPGAAPRGRPSPWRAGGRRRRPSRSEATTEPSRMIVTQVGGLEDLVELVADEHDREPVAAARPARSTEKSSRDSARVSTDVGSSRMSTSGFRLRHLISSTRWRWPTVRSSTRALGSRSIP